MITKNIEIDSLRLRIPYQGFEDCVELKDASLRGELSSNVVNHLTGEIISTKIFPKKSYVHDNGIHSQFGITKVNTSQYGIRECLNMYLNSKMLKERYFEGITLDNIRLVYDYLIGQNVVNFPFELMYEAECTDIDFKMDIRTKDLSQIADYLDEHKKEELENDCKRLKRYENYGIQFYTRKDARNTKCFFKIYDKTAELRSVEINNTEYRQDFTGSNVFRINYLSNIDTHFLARFEYTIKDKKQAKSKLKIDNCRLETLLNLSQETKMQAMKNIIESYQSKEVAKLSKRRISDIILESELIRELKIDNVETVINNRISHIEDRKIKSKTKRFYEDVIMQIQNGSDVQESNSHLQRFYEKYF